MNYKLIATGLLSLIISGCATIAGSVTDKPITTDPEGRSMGEVIDDKSTRTRLLVNLEKLDERFKDANVDIYVNAAIVLLVGEVPTKELVDQATNLIKADPKIKAIHNHLTVGPKLSTSLSANDKWLAVKVRSRMFSTDSFSSSNIDVIVQNGVVYLMGRVARDTATKAVEIASEVKGVQKVVTVFQIIS